MFDVTRYLSVGPWAVGTCSPGVGRQVRSSTNGADSTLARGINLQGLIVGTYDIAALVHGFVATPIPLRCIRGSKRELMQCAEPDIEAVIQGGNITPARGR